VAALRPWVCASRLAAYQRAWRLWRRVLLTLNRVATIPTAEQARFKAGAWASGRLISGSFPWLSTSPKLHMLFAHSWEFLGRWGSMELYEEQAIESWYGFNNKQAPRLTAGAALLSCRKLLQTMALSGVASDALRLSKALICKRRVARSRAMRSENRRLRQNTRQKCHATLQKRMDDGAKLSEDQFVVAIRVVETYTKN